MSLLAVLDVTTSCKIFTHLTKIFFVANQTLRSCKQHLSYFFNHSLKKFHQASKLGHIDGIWASNILTTESKHALGHFGVLFSSSSSTLICSTV